MIKELKRQLDETVQTREIHLSYLIGQPKKVKKETSPNRDKSLKFARDIDRELYELLGSENTPVLTKPKHKQTNKQKP